MARPGRSAGGAAVCSACGGEGHRCDACPDLARGLALFAAEVPWAAGAVRAFLKLRPKGCGPEDVSRRLQKHRNYVAQALTMCRRRFPPDSVLGRLVARGPGGARPGEKIHGRKMRPDELVVCSRCRLRGHEPTPENIKSGRCLPESAADAGYRVRDVMDGAI